TEVVVVTTFGRTGYLRRAMDAGARGFRVKDLPITACAAAIRRAAAGESVIYPDLAARALTAGSNPLTGRERDVLAAAEGGAPIAEIARTLHLSQSTVRNYLSSAIGKTSARNRAEALGSAREQGWRWGAAGPAGPAQLPGCAGTGKRGCPRGCPLPAGGLLDFLIDGRRHAAPPRGSPRLRFRRESPCGA